MPARATNPPLEPGQGRTSQGRQPLRTPRAVPARGQGVSGRDAAGRCPRHSRRSRCQRWVPKMGDVCQRARVPAHPAASLGPPEPPLSDGVGTGGDTLGAAAARTGRTRGAISGRELSVGSREGSGRIPGPTARQALLLTHRWATSDRWDPHLHHSSTLSTDIFGWMQEWGQEPSCPPPLNPKSPSNKIPRAPSRGAGPPAAPARAGTWLAAGVWPAGCLGLDVPQIFSVLYKHPCYAPLCPCREGRQTRPPRPSLSPGGSR